MSRAKVRVMFLCMGNICRSPVAEGVFRHKVKRAGLEGRVEIASSGTGGWHVGEPPDPRMCAAAKAREVDLSPQRARQLAEEDFRAFDLILAMDRNNLAHAQRLVRPDDASAELKLFRDFDPAPGDRQVPDPYYGGAAGFEEVLDIVERTCEALLAHLREAHGL